MAETLRNLSILIFPGLVLTLVVGLFASWLVRKVSALVQWRVGPPLFQPVFDVLKLLGKEILVPQDAHMSVFWACPLVGFSAVLLLSTMLLQSVLKPESAFVGDIIVAVYLMAIPSLALILGSSASGSSHAAIGTSREMKLVMAYELPLVLALIVVIIKSGGQLGLAEIAQHKVVFSISGLLSFLAALMCIQAKLGFVPFDIAEAETELAGGVLMEYSGGLLAIWKLMQAMMLVALPMFLVIAFLGGFGMHGGALFAGIGKYVLVLVLIILIKNTNPRVRIDQAMKFFWFYCSPVLALAVVLAMLGSILNIGWL